jgi:Subtilase family/Fervidolysin N-terminal prodomain
MTPGEGCATPVALATGRHALIPVLGAVIALASAACASSAQASQLLVRFRASVGDERIRGTLTAVGAHQAKAIPDLGVRVVSVPAAASEHALATLSRSRNVQYAERDAQALPQDTIPNDPFFPQGSLALGGGAWGWYQTHTTGAWDITQGDPSVVIAILDTGLKARGLDFSGQVVPGWNVLSNTSDTSTEAGNHGTYVAGAAGMAADSGSGNAGYCPGCKLMPVQVGTDSGASYSSMASGITWAADHGARVENLSWAGTSSSAVLAEAVSYARSKGVVVFAAAGNSNCDCATYPAATPGVLGVAGVSSSGEKATDSNYGSWVALAAPEGNMSAWPSLNGAPGYAQVGGTSLASPAAAGIAGLILSTNPALSGGQVEQLLESSASAAPFAVAHGEVDAMAALSAMGLSDPQGPGPPVDIIAPQMLVETNGLYNNVPLEGSPQVGQKLVRGQGAWRGSSPLSLSRVQWERCAPEGSPCVAVGSSSTYAVQSADAGYRLRLVVTFSDPQGSTNAASSASSQVAGAQGTQSSAPVNTTLPAISGTAQAGQTLNSSSGSWSEAPTSYSYQWQRCDSTGAGCAPISGATASNYEASGADVGYTLRAAVTASNAAGSATAISAATPLVAAAPAPLQTLSFSGFISLKRPTASFAVSVGHGLAEAQLSFASKCATLTLALQSGGGSTLASTTGPSVLELDHALAAGSYVYVVSGVGRCSFTLTVTAPAS